MRMSSKMTLALSALIVLGLLVAFAGLFSARYAAQSQNPFSVYQTSAKFTMHQPNDGWPTPLPPGVTNTPPAPTPGVSYLWDQVPAGVEIITSTSYEAEMLEPEQPAMGESPTPLPLLPTLTPLPKVSHDNRSPYASHNLVLAPGTVPVSEKLGDPTAERVTLGFASWSPDGRLFALTDGVGAPKFFPDESGGGTIWRLQEIILFDALGQELGVLTGGEEPLWSPSGTYLAVRDWNMEQGMGSIKVIELATRKVAVVAIVTMEHTRVLIDWISDTEILYYLGTKEEGNLLIFNVTSNKQYPLLTGAVAEEITKDASGEKLRVASALPSMGLISIWTTNAIYVLRRDAVGLRTIHTIEEKTAGHVLFAPDGDTIAYSIGDGLHIISLSHPVRQPVEISVGYPSLPVTWSPDSSSLIFLSNLEWYIVNQDGSGLRRLTELPEGTYAVQWTPQGLWTMYGEGAESQMFTVVTR